MKIVALLLLVTIFNASNVKAQVCTGNIVLETQSDVDNFNINYPSCTELVGNLFITGDEISDIGPLSQLAKVTGDFEIINCQNLASINDIELNVIGNIRILENESLIEINGFTSTDSLKTLNISENPVLNTVAGFDNLRIAMDSLHIYSNDSLKSIPSFNNLDFVDRIEIDENRTLSSVFGFNSLDTVQNVLQIGDVPIISGFNSLIKGGSIFISHTDIRKIEGFNNVERITGGLALGRITQEEPIEIFNKVKTIGFNLILGVQGGEFNSLLKLEEVQNNMINILECNFQNLDFLSNMKRMGGFKPFVRIDDCPNLTDISGLDGIDPETVNWFRIRRNENLSICHSDLVCAVLERGDNDPPSVWIDNAEGCNNDEEILEACANKLPDEPEDPTLCPIASRPGMQIDRVENDKYNIMYHYGVKRMYLRDVAYTELLELIEFHKLVKDILFNFDTFTLKHYCERAELISKGAVYNPNLPTDPIMEYKKDQTMSEIDFFSNFVLTINIGESVKL